MFSTKDILKNFTKSRGKHLCQSLFFNKTVDLRPATLLKKETLAQVFSCQFCKNFKNTFFYRTPPVAASEVYFSSHQRNIVFESILNGKTITK